VIKFFQPAGCSSPSFARPAADEIVVFKSASRNQTQPLQ
jgi:hypothetical protein